MRCRGYQQVSPKLPTPKTKRLLEAVQTKLGITLTMTRVLAKKERVAGNDFEGVRKAGIGDGQIEEIITIAAREVEDA